MDVKAINLRTLKRIDPSIRDILESSSQSALYTFDLKGEKFVKNEVEGSLHVFRRRRRTMAPSSCQGRTMASSCQGRTMASSNHGFIILDMSSTRHFMEDLKHGSVIQVVKYYPHNLLLFTSINGSVHCLWFEEENECQRMYQVIKSSTSL